ncbi:BTAD domain-containing putative transcriptional regulator [Streptomyces sp. NPDC048172]|uniref:AfsR/SARP family transcriptional regulator n=1 Tax=Streptomyces sp. NPDC048172 TaxID=3365505 RepID=UPI0037174690
MNSGQEDAPRFALLGPLRAWRGGRELDLGSPQQRVVLAMLLLRRGRLVTTAELVDAVWGEDPPATAVPVLRTYVSRLRKVLRSEAAAAGSPQVVVSAADGYLARVPHGSVDLGVFEERVAEAQRLRAAGELPAAAERLRAALAEGEGTPLAGLPGPLAEAERSRLTEERFGALEARLDIEVQLGRYDGAVAELRTLLALHPLRERLCRLLMLALHRTGRSAEALACYDETRRTLVTELGIEPSPPLRELHDSIRAADDVPLPRARETGPAQLPPDLTSFVGRSAELAQLQALLPDRSPPPTVVVATVSGMAGAGKTALAVRWAHQVADRFPDGQLFLNLRGFDAGEEPVPAQSALRTFLAALGVPEQQIPAPLDAQASLYRSRLAQRRVLILLDNARDIEQVRPLLPGSPGSLVVVTSRNRLTGLVASAGAHPVTLRRLTPEDGHALLGHRLGAQRTAAEPAAADEIVARCARLPLALAVAAARAAANPGFPLSAIAEELRHSDENLDAFASSDLSTDVRAVFSWSYAALSAPAARLFRLLALPTGPDVSAHTAAALAGLGTAATRALLAELADAHLLVEHRSGRYTPHDLLRVYAAERLRAAGPVREQERAVERLLSWYLHTMDAAHPLLTPHRRRLRLEPPPPGCLPLAFTDREEAREWCETERANLVAATHFATVSGRGDLAWRLNSALWGFLHLRNHLADRRDASPAALGLARAAHGRAGEGGALSLLALNAGIDGVQP